MSVALTKDSIDLGILTNDAESALAFYRDTLGFKYEAEVPMPDGSTMHRLLCGTSVIKIIAYGKTPPATAPPGGIGGATGNWYWTMSVSNLEEITEKCEAAGYKIIMPVNEFRPGVRISMVEDPDGNFVEFLAA